MNISFRPEGRLLSTKENTLVCSSLSHLRAAMEQETILEGIALFCDSNHTLMVQLDRFMGRIPRAEGAIGISEGQTKEVALLSRVGQPVCAVVTAIHEDGTLTLSRRRAQELARTHFMNHLRAGEILPATVTHLEPFGAFVDIGCGLPSMLGLETLSVSRTQHPNQRFSIGQEIYAVVTGIDRQLSRVFLTHKELLGTWEENAAQFSPGMTVTGIVRSIKDYGAFVELTPNLSGLAETNLPLAKGDRVSVYIKSIQPDRMKMKLSVIRTLPSLSSPAPLCYYQTKGRITRWQYAPAGCSKIGAVSVFVD